MTTTSYDTVAYPTAMFPQTHPDRLALIAQLHGLTAAAPERARVLEIGGGDGFNLIALAAAFPQAQFVSFDLSAAAVARGQALAAASGMANICIEQADIMDYVAAAAPGSFDYIIAHGVYAWVPGPVQQAVMALAGKALAPDGLFFVSYNALPGGHIRRVMREMLLDALADVHGIEARIAAARAFLENHARPREGDDSVVSAMRAQSVAMLSRPDAVLFHDELGEVFSPQSLADTAAAATAVGLEFLNDSGRNRLGDGFLPDGAAAQGPVPTEAIVQAAQRDDYAAMRFFRQSLFTRAGRNPGRTPALDVLRGCHAAGQFQLGDNGAIQCGETTFALRDHGLQDWLLQLGSGWPAHRPVAEIADPADRLDGLFELFKLGLLHLSTAPPPFTLGSSAHPLASPLVRAQIALGHPAVTTLHFEQMQLPDPAARGLLARLDGQADHAELAQVWAALPHDPALQLADALALIAAQRLLRA
ncbi:class I SAM-dependent methyltransferase [Novosphingobium sp.]|uniref:class I SAM-dependent methyltransferase n=1 Tax=Novosphingobium sp. TaxID=1874826 RepID=UPI0027357CE1|nr:class I SAM-dependent methyltransferase [Novosphingobium sp.]MDP3908206.1 class I SAM-dependent methyltransferase [Novosphingobium sp.]